VLFALERAVIAMMRDGVIDHGSAPTARLESFECRQPEADVRDDTIGIRNELDGRSRDAVAHALLQPVRGMAAKLGGQDTEPRDERRAEVGGDATLER
jgi:hypothetical protein